MMIRSLLIAFSIAALLGPLPAKKTELKGIPKECKVHKPMYSHDFLNQELLDAYVEKNYEVSEKTNEYWVAYSDRSHNVTYVTNSTATPYSELGFKEKVRIARIRKGFALVYKTQDESAAFPQIPEDVEWKGWIPMQNLVFMDKAMVNDLGIPISVLVNDRMDFDSQLRLNAKLYFNPGMAAEPVVLPSCSNSIFYVCKTEADAVLLATDTDLTSPSHIYGWMKYEDLFMWTSRIALEPTWDGMDNDYLAKENHTSDLLGLNDERIGNVDFVQGQGGDKFMAEYHRLNFGAWRYPVMARMAGGSTFCAFPGQSSFLDKPSQRIPVHANQNASDSFSFWDADAREAGINIMFVIDGSRLYEPFFPILAQRISLLDNESGLPNINVGALIYHDARSGQYMTEMQELTAPSDATLFDFIDMGGTYGFKDNLSEAPLLAALDKAVNEAGFNSQAQNFVVLIGGRGDSSDSALIPSDMARKLAMNNIGLFALQVQNNPQTTAYRLFGYLMEDIMRKSVEYKFDSPVSTLLETGEEYSSISYFADSGSGAEAFDSFKSINSGLMSEEDFESHLESILQWINSSVESSMDHSASLASMYPQFFRGGYVDVTWNGREQFKSVALYSLTEFDRLISMFARLHEMHLAHSADRELFYSILVDYLPPFVKFGTYYYPYDKKNVSDLDAGLKKMGLYQVFSLIEGVVDSSSYAGPLMKDILSPKDVTDKEFMFLLSDFSRRYYRLLTIRNNPELYRTYINNQSYFWIPCDDLL